MGITPVGNPHGAGPPTIRFWMAADAINVSDTCDLTDVRHYLANLGMTMESQVRSFVAPPVSPLLRYYPLLLTFLFSPCTSLCAALPFRTSQEISRRSQFALVAARQSRTRILAVTE